MSQLPGRPDRGRTRTSRCAAGREVAAARGDGHLEALTLADRGTGDDARRWPATWLFVFIGAAPRTDWLGEDVVRDDHGFVVTGPDLGRPSSEARLAAGPARRTRWRRACPGVFAAGDVRLDSMKRVASAVGEGAMAVHLVHRYLATI